MASSTPVGKDHPLVLTIRQQQLLGLLAEGCSNKEIARKFLITEGTVKQHLVTLYRKLGVGNRNRAALIGQRLEREGALQKLAAQSTTGGASPYQWRFINAIALTLPMINVSNAVVLRDRDVALDYIHDRFGKLVEAFEGVSLTTPCGGLLAWFGHPRAHSDDADRVVQLAYLAQMLRHSAGERYPALKQLGIGVASQNEMVRESSRLLYGAQVFSNAIALAARGHKASMAVCTALTAQLGHLPVRWTKLSSDHRPQQGLKGVGMADSCVGLIDTGAGADILAKPWGGLPFLPGICEQVRSGHPEWIAVSTEQSSGLDYLLAAVSASASGAGMWSIDLRMPGRSNRESILRSLFLQLEDAADFPADQAPRAEQTAGERLAGVIRLMAERRPLSLLIHGHNGLQLLRQVLTEHGLNALQKSPLMLIGHQDEDLRGRAVIKTLGPRGTGVPFNRTFELVMPALGNQQQGHVIGIRAILDRLSPLARETIVKSAHAATGDVLPIIFDSVAPVYEVQNALSELQLMGLVVPHGESGYVFKDGRVPKIICALDAG